MTIYDEDDAPELTDELLAQMRPAREVLPPELLAQFRPARGRPPSDSPKVAVSIRLDADVVARFKATGAGWQTRMNEALRAAAVDLAPAAR